MTNSNPQICAIRLVCTSVDYYIRHGTPEDWTGRSKGAEISRFLISRKLRRSGGCLILKSKRLPLLQKMNAMSDNVPTASNELTHFEEDIVQRIRAVLPDVQGIYLFGSRAAGQARPDSDYDVAVLCNLPVSGGDLFFRLQIDLASLTDEGVNLVDLRSLPIVLQFEVLCGRRRLYCADREFCILFEAGILSEYQRFEEERRPVITEFFNRRLAHVQK